MSGFIITEEDIKRINTEFSKNLPKLQQDAAASKNQIHVLAGLSDFKGQAAENMKAYMSEVHGFMLDNIAQIATVFLSSEENYRRGIQAIERQAGFVLPEEQMGTFSDKLLRIRNEASEINRGVNRTVAEVSNIVSLRYVNQGALDAATDKVRLKTKTLIEQVKTQEAKTVASLADLENYVAVFERCIGEIGVGSWGEMSQYQKGSFAKNGFAELLSAMYITQYLSERGMTKEQIDFVLELGYTNGEIREICNSMDSNQDFAMVLMKQACEKAIDIRYRGDNIGLLLQYCMEETENLDTVNKKKYSDTLKDILHELIANTTLTFPSGEIPLGNGMSFYYVSNIKANEDGRFDVDVKIEDGKIILNKIGTSTEDEISGDIIINSGTKTISGAISAEGSKVSFGEDGVSFTQKIERGSQSYSTCLKASLTEIKYEESVESKFENESIKLTAGIKVDNKSNQWGKLELCERPEYASEPINAATHEQEMREFQNVMNIINLLQAEKIAEGIVGIATVSVVCAPPVVASSALAMKNEITQLLLTGQQVVEKGFIAVGNVASCIQNCFGNLGTDKVFAY